MYRAAMNRVALGQVGTYLLMNQAAHHHRELMAALEKLDKPRATTIVPSPISYPTRD